MPSWEFYIGAGIVLAAAIFWVRAMIIDIGWRAAGGIAVSVLAFIIMALFAGFMIAEGLRHAG